MPHNPKRLLVLEKAKALAIDTHLACDKHRRSMRDRAPTLRAQILRAVDSIPLNIGEGASKDSPAAFVYSLDVAIGSSNEVEVQLELAVAIKALPERYACLIDQVIEVRKMTVGLRKKLLADS